MALTSFQRSVIRSLARARIERGESYVAGAAALNTLTMAPRVSQDLDIFHDTTQAVEASWQADRALLINRGFAIELLREREGYVEALVRKGADTVLLQWTRDSAFRFFPLIEHEDFGLTLHPFDHATNKVLALVGRLEVRDWVDVVSSTSRIQPLGYLVWAACGKDPGFSPQSILEQAGRSTRYSSAEVEALHYEGEAPDAAALSLRWRGMLEEARELIALLPPEHTGKCVLDLHGELLTTGPEGLPEALTSSSLRFHEGRIKGAWPAVG